MRVSDFLARNISSRDAAQLLKCSPRTVTKARRGLGDARSRIGWDDEIKEIDTTSITNFIERKNSIDAKRELDHKIIKAHREYEKALTDEYEKALTDSDDLDSAIERTKEMKTNYTRLLAKAKVKISPALKLLEIRNVRVRKEIKEIKGENDEEKVA